MVRLPRSDRLHNGPLNECSRPRYFGNFPVAPLPDPHASLARTTPWSVRGIRIAELGLPTILPPGNAQVGSAEQRTSIPARRPQRSHPATASRPLTGSRPPVGLGVSHDGESSAPDPR